MSWKKTQAFFIWQSIRYAVNWSHFTAIWSFRTRWVISFQPGRNSVSDELPWLNFLALEFLTKNIRSEYRVFEYGGGGSTLFFCKYVARVATVEDHKDWFKTLTDTVRAKGYHNWTGFFVSPESIIDPSPRSHRNPADFKSSVKGLENMSFEKYARAIEQYPEKYFDVVLVDGRARPSCIVQAIPRLKSGGLLVVDNTERTYYLDSCKDILANDFIVLEDRMAPVAYTPDFTRTTILQKR